MRPGSFSESPPSDHPRGRREHATTKVRKARLRRAALESLEQRALLSTLPPAVIGRVNVSNPFEITRDNSDENAPSIAVNPTNPNHLVASWTRFDSDFTANNQILVEAAVSLDGGASWTRIATPPRRIDPSTGTNPQPYPTYSNASVAFDRDGGFYLLTLQNNAVTSGHLLLRRYAPDGTPLTTPAQEVVYAWNRSAEGQAQAKAVLHPILAVDNTAPSFVDPSGPSGNVTNPHAGNVYVAFIGETPPPQGATNWNPLTVDLVRSTDGGATFGPRNPQNVLTPLVLNGGGNFGNQRNTRPRIAVSQGGGGSQPGQVTVVWDDFGTGATAGVPFSAIRSRQVFGGGLTPGAEATVAFSPRILGNQAGGGTLGGLTAEGVGPSPSIAVDNTLGASSAHRGRLYVAYTARIDDQVNNPADNTDIFLAFSDNGGASWSTNFTPVNDDRGIVDGFSGAEFGVRGRPQFMPEVAVDPGTGTLVVQFYDARHDASRGRVATYVTASINGGDTFSPQAFVNQPETVFDVATGGNRVVGPIPDNQVSAARTSFGYGTRQGLAVLDGRVYSAWSGNLNGGPNGELFLDVRVARATLPSGPRVLDGTSGVVSTTNANGTPEARWFDLTFDRPIDPSTFSTDDVAIRFLSPDGATSQAIAANNVIQLDPRRFRVEFPGSTSPGTYSYAVGPDVRDLIRTVDAAGNLVRTGNLMDQDGNAVPDAGQGGDVRFAMPRPVAGGSALTGPFVRETLPLIVPGPRVVQTRAVRPDGSTVPTSGPVLNGRVAGIEVVFDRDMMAGTFTADDVIRIVGPGGEVDRASVQVAPIGAVNGVARTFRVTFAEQQLSGTYQVVLGSNIQSMGGHLVDSNGNAGVDVLRGRPASTTVELSFASAAVPRAIPANGVVESALVVDKAFEITDVDVQLNIAHLNVPNLRAELIAPDGRTVLLFAGVGDTGSRADFINTIFDDQAAQAIAAGTPPFSDRYRPQQALGILNSTPGTPTPSGTYTLRITNTGGVTGTLNSWRLIMRERVTGTGLGEPVADRIRADFAIFTMDPTAGLSSSTWTPVGPAPVQNGEGAGRVSAVAVDPSDPSGNTVYVGAASGGVWKTNDFLTTDSGGPTWIPLTDAVATNGLRVGGIAVFGRNNDPNRSIVLVATGEGAAGTPGVGFLRSGDGGSSWELLDSADNRVPFAQRGREFVGTTAFKVVADQNPTPTGQAIFYAALSGAQGGLWRSTDSGDTWQLLRAGQANDVVLDPGSGAPTVNNPTGNLQILYAAFRDQGVFISPNQGQQLNLMPGGVGKPRVRDGDLFDRPTIPVGAPDRTPNGDKGRIVLAKPALTGDDRQDLLYQGWLYAAVANDNNTLDGVYLTKDQGQNWTRLRLPTETSPAPWITQYPVFPSNNTTLADHDVTANAEHQLANYALALTVDPTNPHVIYLGGTRDGGGQTSLIRIDSTFVHDPHAFFLSSDLPGGAVRRNYVDGPAVVKTGERDRFPVGFDPRTNPTINLYRDPSDPFDATATTLVNRTASFSNSGAGVRWTPFDQAIDLTSNVQEAFSLIDPLTGRGRLIFGGDRGVFTAVDAGDGTPLTGIGLGNTVVPTGDRNGNIQISQIYYGAVQPSRAAAQVAGTLFHVQTDANGFPRSASDILQTGNLNWGSPRLASEAGTLSGSGVAVDPTGSGASYQYNWRSGGDAPKFPFFGGQDFRTDFFLVDVTRNGFPHDAVGRTSGLLQATGGTVPDPQWPFPNRNAVLAGAPGGANFAVNPIEPDHLVISAPGSGRVFRTLDRGLNWLEIGLPSVLGGSYFQALAFGAPEPGAPAGSVGDHVIGGNLAGQVYVTYTGGGAAGTQWTQINNGDLEGNTAPFWAIATNPLRGSYEAYAVTSNGVYHIADTRPASGAAWEDVTANLFEITHDIFGDSGFEDVLLAPGGLRSLAVDWRYAIPTDFDSPPSNPTDPDLTHPVLYVGGVGGAFASYDDGGSWLRFPSAFPDSINTTPEVPGAGGGLPVVEVRDLDLSLGDVNRATGLPISQAGDPNLLMASTFGRGAFAIRLGPVVFPESLRLVVGDRRLPIGDRPPAISPSDLVFEGFSAQSAAGNAVRLRAFEIGPDDQILRVLALVDANGAPVVPTTDSAGNFILRVAPGALPTSGLKRIGIQAEQGGTTGNIAVFELVVNVPAPALTPESDTGRSDSDNITSDNTPTFQLVVTEGEQIRLFRRPAGTAEPFALVGDPDADGRVTDPGPGGAGVPDGVYEYATNVAGIFSDLLIVTIDTTPPAAPGAPASVTGDVTSASDPSFTVAGAEPNAEVRLYRRRITDPASPAPLIVASAIAGADGVVTIRDPGPLADADYEYSADQVDLAGNVGPMGPPRTLQVRGSVVQPPAATLLLAPADDTGVPGDNITSNRRPRLIGTTAANATVQLVDAAGEPLGAPVQAGPDGAFTLQFPGDLADGTYTVRARVLDTTGNVGRSDSLAVTIDTTAPPGIADLGIAPESDTGLRGDLRTSDRRPILTGTTEPGSFVRIFARAGDQDQLLVSGTADAQGRFRFQVPGLLTNGPLVVRARSRDAAGNEGAFGPEVTLSIVTDHGDYDNDGRADLALYRPGTAAGESRFLINRSTAGGQAIGGEAFRSTDPASPLFNFQLRPGDIPVSGDFDGDGIVDVAVFRPESDRSPGSSEWFILGSRTGPRAVLFGGSGLDVPAVGDFDGDGIADIAVFRPVSDLLPGAAEWFILPSSTGQAFRVSFGAAGGLDLPAVGDFDGDGRDDIAVFRPNSDLVPGAAQWFFLPSSRNDLTFSERIGGYSVLFGEGGVDQPVPLDYDGDGIADIATYRPTTSEWFILRSGLPVEVAGRRIPFGAEGDLPAPADYDGDGIADLAVFRPSTGGWTIRPSTGGADTETAFGTVGDVPILAPLAYRDPRTDSIANPRPSASATGSGGSIAQARQVAGSPLDLGRQANRLSNAAGGRFVEARIRQRAEAQDRLRALRADAGGRPAAGFRALLTDLSSRRRGGEPRA